MRPVWRRRPRRRSPGPLRCSRPPPPRDDVGEGARLLRAVLVRAAGVDDDDRAPRHRGGGQAVGSGHQGAEAAQTAGSDDHQRGVAAERDQRRRGEVQRGQRRGGQLGGDPGDPQHGPREQLLGLPQSPLLLRARGVRPDVHDQQRQTAALRLLDRPVEGLPAVRRAVHGCDHGKGVGAHAGLQDRRSTPGRGHDRPNCDYDPTVRRCGRPGLTGVRGRLCRRRNHGCSSGVTPGKRTFRTVATSVFPRKGRS